MKKTIKNIPDVETMLLDDVCGFVKVPSAAFYCKILSGQGMERGLIYLLGYYEEAMNNYLDTYDTSDKSAAVLMDIQRHIYNDVPALFVLMVNGALTLSDMIDNELGKQLKANQEGKVDFMVACSVVSVLMGILMWMFILRKLRDGTGQFKNVLKVLPADVILSSFILKTFLNKTSQGGFNSTSKSINS